MRKHRFFLPIGFIFAGVLILTGGYWSIHHFLPTEATSTIRFQRIRQVTSQMLKEEEDLRFPPLFRNKTNKTERLAFKKKPTELSVKKKKEQWNKLHSFRADGVTIRESKNAYYVLEPKVLFYLNKDKKMDFHSKVKRIWIDVGGNKDSFTNLHFATMKYSHDKPTIHVEFAKKPQDLAVVVIEANVAFYDGLMKIPNIKYVIPCAVPSNGMVRFYHFQGDGCSSIAPPNENLTVPMHDNCKKVIGTTDICSTSLKSIMDMIPEGLEIELCKIDIQGLDLDAAKSAGMHLRRVKIFVIEVQGEMEDGSTDHLLYAHRTGLKAEALQFFEENGYSHEEELSYLNNEALLECNLVFHRIDDDV